MCSHGSGVRGNTQGNAWWMVLSGQIRKSAPAPASFSADAASSAFDASTSPANFAHSASFAATFGGRASRRPDKTLTC